jgi:hypothetical protein
LRYSAERSKPTNSAEVVTHLRHRQQNIAVMHSRNIIAHGAPRKWPHQGLSKQDRSPHQ